jgi:hypothetical protein
MEAIGWNTALFISKWILIGLIYSTLFIVLIAVRREMSLRLRSDRVAPAPEPGKLQVLTPGNDPNLRAGEMLVLKPETCLGADPDNDIVLGDRYVSGRHACLRWDGASWSLEDLDSRNGTFVDHNRCQPYVPQNVQPGTMIQMGDVTFKLVGA